MERRNFLKISATVGVTTVVTACGSSKKKVLPKPQPAEIVEPIIEQTKIEPAKTEPTIVEPVEEKISWSSCLVNCGSNCPVKVFTQDDRIVRIETDHQGDDKYGSHQVRACLRGRSLRQRTYAADRLKTPLKRKPGTKRGAGEFVEISWDDAFNEIATKLKDIQSNHGPRAVYNNYASGAYYTFHSYVPIAKALALSGGYLRNYGDYSFPAFTAVDETMGVGGGSRLTELTKSDLFIGFGYNPFETRMSGSGESYDMRSNILANNNSLDICIVDPRYTDTIVASSTQKQTNWYPIRPGTDGALAEAICYEMISSGWVEKNSKAWIDSHVFGFDKASMEKEIQSKTDAIKNATQGDKETPEQFQARKDTLQQAADIIDSEENFSDYILREGKFAGEEIHNAAWAAGVCGVPEQKIKELTNKITNASAPFIVVGGGINRQACGEQNVRCLYMLPILTGKIGQPGTNNGARPSSTAKGGMSTFPSGKNPEEATISCFTWSQAIDDGENMTERKDGVKGLGDDDIFIGEDGKEDKKLGTSIKAIFSINGNALINQHADVNNTRRILEDESKCELIVSVDCWMTASANYSDYILPDTTWLETDDIAGNSYAAGLMGYVTFMKAAVKPMYKCRNMFDIGQGLAKALGKETDFLKDASSGFSFFQATPAGKDADAPKIKTREEWLEDSYGFSKMILSRAIPTLPDTFAEAQKVGLYRSGMPAESYIASEAFAANPEAHKFGTPSGKIEVHSLDFASKAKDWIPASTKGYDQITALPKYTPSWQGFEETKDSKYYPLQACEYHTKGRTHSSYHNVAWLREAVEDCVWVNPLDANNLGIANGSKVIVTSPQGSIQTKLRITPRIIPGVVGLAQGAWYKGGKGQIGEVDMGGCSNTLTKYHPMPISKGDPMHTFHVNIVKA